MASLSSKPSDRAICYQSLSNFYSADSRRRASHEQDVGLWWRVGAYGPVYRAAWVCETGELYVVRLGPLQDGKGEVVVLGRAQTRDELDRVLEGWQDVCPQPDSMTWLRHQATGLAPAEKPAQSFAGASASHLYGLAAGRLSQRRRKDARGFPPSESVPERAERGRVASRPSVSRVSRLAPPQGSL
jgi:hypothetical protein